MKERFLQFVLENEGIIYKVCKIYCNDKDDRGDLFQDIIYQLWKAYPSFKGEAKASTWMYRIALNTAITKLRKDVRNRLYKTIDDEVLEIPVPSFSEEKENRLELLSFAISLLSDLEKALMMLYMEEHNYAEMAEILGISESNVGFKINKIKSKLKSIITKQS